MEMNEYKNSHSISSDMNFHRSKEVSIVEP